MTSLGLSEAPVSWWRIERIALSGAATTPDSIVHVTNRFAGSV